MTKEFNLIEDLREKVLQWANMWGYKGISRECEDELKSIFDNAGADLIDNPQTKYPPSEMRDTRKGTIASVISEQPEDKKPSSSEGGSDDDDEFDGEAVTLAEVFGNKGGSDNHSPQKELENEGVVSRRSSDSFEPMTDRRCDLARNFKSKVAPKINNKYGRSTEAKAINSEVERRCQDITMETNSPKIEDKEPSSSEGGSNLVTISKVEYNTLREVFDKQFKPKKKDYEILIWDESAKQIKTKKKEMGK